MRFPEDYSGAKSDQHLVELWLSGRPESTRVVYNRTAQRFLAELPVGIQEAKVEHVVAWAEALRGAIATKSRKVSTVKSLLSFAHRVGYTVFNVGRVLRVPRPPNMLHERIVEVDVVHAVIHEAEAGRDQALVRLLYASGCRISEAVGLRFKDLGTGGRVTFIRAKRNKVRTVVIPEPIVEELRALRWTTDLDTAPIFKTFRGKALCTRHARRIVAEAARETGAYVCPHMLRHAHASHALDNGAPIHLVQTTLGHENVATTSRYLHARPNDGSSRFLVIPD